MGLFEEAGRRFEQFKREAESAAEETADFECAACGERLFARREECPECGSEDVVAVEDEDEDETE